MPSDELDQTSPQADRLSRKIDRLQIGQPSSVHDGDTEELADLARLLMEQLDKTQPDPVFRNQLKRDLIDPSPRLVNFKPRPGPRRYPVPALFGALTVVLVASAVTGWMVFADHGGNAESAVDRVAGFAVASPTAASATGAIISASRVATLEPMARQTRTTAAIAGSESTEAQPLPTDEHPAQQDSAQQPPTTIQKAVVELPPVDARHVELGALATVVSTSNNISPDIEFSPSVDPATIELPRSGVAYSFSTPYVEPDFILRGVEKFLGIEAQIDQRERGGKMIYSLSSGEGSISFTWSPASGAFSCTLPNPYSTSDIEDLSQAAVQWLQEFGFPVGNSGVSPVIQTMEDGRRFVHVPLGDRQLPNPAVGHPMSITLVVDPEGRIVSVSGYWLEVTDQDDVALVTAEQAWQQVRSGKGYWPEGSAPRKAGEFVAEHFEVSYMLTSSEGAKKGLSLQPVIAISGNFYPADGSDSYSTTVYVKGMSEL
jgi:hypothetical protein